MKISELIARLQEIAAESGDIEIGTVYDEDGAWIGIQPKDIVKIKVYAVGLGNDGEIIYSVVQEYTSEKNANTAHDVFSLNGPEG